MMNYGDFKKAVTKEFMKFLPEEYQNYELQIHPMEKVNCTLDALIIEEPGAKINIFPVVYINDMYEDYKEWGDLYGVIRSVANQMGIYLKERIFTMDDINMKNIKEKIVFQLINTEQNKELLADRPNRSFQDLSVIYRLVIKRSEQMTSSIVINNWLAEEYGLSEEQLYSIAMENTKKLFPPVIKKVKDKVSKEDIESPMNSDKIDEDFPLELEAYVCTNKSGFYGANIMLYEDVLYDISSELKDNLYILPSSIYEVVILPSENYTPNKLAQLVEKMNMEVVALGDRLSNKVYCYDRHTRQVNIAYDLPNKRLDGSIIGQKTDYHEKGHSR